MRLVSRFFNCVVVFGLCLLSNNVWAQEAAEQSKSGLAFIGAAIAVGLSAIAAGIAVGYIGAAAMGAIAEKPEVSGRALIFLGLAEGIAIYGVIIAIMILGKV